MLDRREFYLIDRVNTVYLKQGCENVGTFIIQVFLIDMPFIYALKDKG